MSVFTSREKGSGTAMPTLVGAPKQRNVRIAGRELKQEAPQDVLTRQSKFSMLRFNFSNVTVTEV